jgi:hypothetical protein
MSTIFENSIATEKYANGSNEPLGVDDAENEVVAEGGNDIPTTPDVATNTTAEHEHGGSSSVTRPNKRTKTVDFDSDPLVATFTSSSKRLAIAKMEWFVDFITQRFLETSFSSYVWKLITFDLCPLNSSI